MFFGRWNDLEDNMVQRAEVLIEALPYIKRFWGKTVVVKYGGNAMVNEDLQKTVALDIILLKYVGINPVLVHGGGPEITKMLDRVGKETNFIEGLRVTDDETMEIVEMVLVGKINKQIVNLINRHGGKAVGLSGKDGDLIMARKHEAISRINGDIIDIGHVGDVEEVNPEVIRVLASQGYIPVISPVGVTHDGISLNINADHVAGEVAGALRADKLILLTDVEGVLEEADSAKRLVSSLTVQQAREFIESGAATSGMIPKLEACIKAVESGTGSVHIIDGRKPHSILLELFTDSGIGTMVTK